MFSLNPEQQQAVHLIDRPLLVLAGAGSGKTRVITEKILYLIRRCQYKPSTIFAVTFTNKAAREMQSRLAKQISLPAGDKIAVSTFHTLGLSIIRQEHKRCSLKRNFTIFDDQDVSDLLRQLADKKKIDKQLLMTFKNAISNWKNARLSPKLASQEAAGGVLKEAAKLYQQYQDSLRAYNAVDFDDLILIPTELFDQHPDVLEQWRMKIRYLLVDEYQDTNRCQYLLVKQLLGGRNALTVVGDDDQSIYAWRGARPENLAELKDDFNNLAMIKLEQNYRSTASILKSANHLIANNPHMFEKKLWSELGDGEKIRIIENEDDHDEAEKTAASIRAHQLIHKTEYSDYAILYRSNRQARLVEQALRKQDLPYQITGGLSFFSRTEIKDLMAYCRLLVNTDDDAAFLRVINLPRRGIGLKSLQAIGTYAGKRHCGLYQACRELGLAEQLGAAVMQKVQRFVDWFERYRAQIASGDPIATLRSLLESIDYRGWLMSLYEKKEDAESRMMNIEELLSWMADSYQQDDINNLGDILTKFMLIDSIDQNDKKNNAIQLMTLHAAKGLEFPFVFIVGMEEEICPHRNSIDENNIEEERRLAYVGITRARNELTFSYCKERKIHGKSKYCEPSRFLSELPEHLINWAGKSDSSEETVKKNAISHLSAMRDLLG